MALSKIKKANKKHRREMARRKRRAQVGEISRQSRVKQKRMRQLFIQGKKEHQAQRRSEKSYVDNLTEEVLGEK